MKMYVFCLPCTACILHYVYYVQGRTNNISHPAIPALIWKFFYTGPDSLAALYPEHFSEEVPDRAIALAMTCVSISFSHAIDFKFSIDQECFGRMAHIRHRHEESAHQLQLQTVSSRIYGNADGNQRSEIRPIPSFEIEEE